MSPIRQASILADFASRDHEVVMVIDMKSTQGIFLIGSLYETLDASNVILIRITCVWSALDAVTLDVMLFLVY